jgi:hypothetical protein
MFYLNFINLYDNTSTPVINNIMSNTYDNTVILKTPPCIPIFPSNPSTFNVLYAR